MNQILLKCLVLAFGLSNWSCQSVSSENVGLQIEQSKREDDQRIAALSQDSMDFEKVLISSSDGQSIPAYLFQPLNSSGEPRPAIVFLHGGEHGMFSSRRLKRVQALVERGWVVLAPDYRGSSGYGTQFYERADYGGLEIDDVLAARDWLVELGYSGEGQVAVLGSSHGGYNALMAVARRPNAFVTCVDFYGPTDLVYRVASTPEENPNAAPGDPAKFALMVGATLEESEQSYRDRSPRFLAERMLASILVIHGTEDGVVNIRESEWLLTELAAAKHPDFEFIRVEGGKHGYPAETYVHAWKRVSSFLEERF